MCQEKKDMLGEEGSEFKLENQEGEKKGGEIENLNSCGVIDREVWQKHHYIKEFFMKGGLTPAVLC